MNITSPAFKDNEPMPLKYSRRGGDASPPLVFSDVPTEAKSLALVCHDPDAPRAGGFTHWLVWNIAPNCTGFEENSVPSGAVQAVTDWGENNWGGPQPPSGTHRYIFTLYALDISIDLSPTADKNELDQAMYSHVISSTSLVGLFGAPQQ